ncbi:hypothetical protein OH76DRAFT_899878 [Lentinus brumalis]|uniref:Uncharacterized protein n=1 Tax=Lentinus brumalis TaxID=2498619 RepID=A0A371D0T7_9APHY|nr:hypothetical protein OH76DRAFT_899878 [Polyporus brumalis]
MCRSTERRRGHGTRTRTSVVQIWRPNPCPADPTLEGHERERADAVAWIVDANLGEPVPRAGRLTRNGMSGGGERRLLLVLVIRSERAHGPAKAAVHLPPRPVPAMIVCATRANIDIDKAAEGQRDATHLLLVRAQHCAPTDSDVPAEAPFGRLVPGRDPRPSRFSAKV